MKTMTRLWIGLAILIALSPLGLILPRVFKAGDAGGEKLSQIWSAPLPDYTIKGWGEKGPGYSSVAYIMSALAGIAAVSLLVFLIARILAKRGD